MGWKPDHKPIREKYNPKPNAVEARHEERLRKMPCVGCGSWWRIHVHHTMLEFPEKRWRRDHRYQFPVCEECHMGGIHGSGSEAGWAEIMGLDTVAISKRLWAESQAEEANKRYTPPIVTCPKCGATAVAFICSKQGCPVNGGAAYGLETA